MNEDEIESSLILISFKELIEKMKLSKLINKFSLESKDVWI